MSQPPAPRIMSLDVLRGVALVGIVTVNAQDLLHGRRRGDDGRLPTIQHILDLFVQGRFLPIFAFLFGVGMTIFLGNAERRGDKPFLLMLRRLGALALLGVAHSFLHPGEVLLPYALTGAVVMWAHRIPQAVLLPAGAAATVVAAVLGIAPLTMFALFLLGMAVGRTPWLREPRRYRPAYAGVLAVTAAGAVAMLALAPAARGDAQWERLPGTVGLIMAAGYLSAVLLVLPTAAGRPLARVLAPFGRMALSNYISQTLILVLLHITVLPGMVEPATALFAATAILAVQVPLSHWWLSRHEQGPLEHAWRRVTYGNRTGPEVGHQTMPLAVSTWPPQHTS